MTLVRLLTADPRKEVVVEGGRVGGREGQTGKKKKKLYLAVAVGAVAGTTVRKQGSLSLSKELP